MVNGEQHPSARRTPEHLHVYDKKLISVRLQHRAPVLLAALLSSNCDNLVTGRGLSLPINIRCRRYNKPVPTSLSYNISVR